MTLLFMFIFSPQMEQNFTFFLEEFKKKTRTDSVVFLVNSLIIYYVEVHEVMETT